MHLDGGEVDLTSQVHVLAVIVQSHAPSEDPSDCAGLAAAVSSQWSSVIGEMIARESRCVMFLRSLDVVWATSWLG